MTENEMNNQAAQTMPEPIAAMIEQVSRVESLIDDASRQYHDSTRWAEEPSVYDDRSSPTLQEAIDAGFNKLRDMLRDYAAALSQTAGVAEGYVLVPARMELTPENIETLVFMLGGDPAAADVDERWNGGTLWVGETIGDNGEKYYGLNVANVECYEEGSVPIVEFASAQAASGGEDDMCPNCVTPWKCNGPHALPPSAPHPDALEDGTLSKSTAKRVTALAAASVSERARELRERAEAHGGGVFVSIGDIRVIEQALTQQRGEAIARVIFTSRKKPDVEWLTDTVKRDTLLYTTPQPSEDAVREVIGSMLNFADVADKCELTEGNAQVAIRAWATQLESLLSGGSHA